MLAAGFGLAMLLRHDRRLAWTLVAWVGTALVVLPFANPLWPHHLTLVTVPAALVAGVGIATAVARFETIKTDRLVTVSLVVGIIACVGGLVRIGGDVFGHGRENKHRLDADAPRGRPCGS